jgi:hypothetical protein
MGTKIRYVTFSILLIGILGAAISGCTPDPSLERPREVCWRLGIPEPYDSQMLSMYQTFLHNPSYLSHLIEVGSLEMLVLYPKDMTVVSQNEGDIELTGVKVVVNGRTPNRPSPKFEATGRVNVYAFKYYGKIPYTTVKLDPTKEDATPSDYVRSFYMSESASLYFFTIDVLLEEGSTQIYVIARHKIVE